MVSDVCAISTEGAGRAKPRLSVMLDKLSDSSLNFNNDNQQHRLYKAEFLPQGYSDFS